MAEGAPATLMSASEIFSPEVSTAEALTQALRRSVGIRIKYGASFAFDANFL